MIVKLLADLGIHARKVTPREWAANCPACGGTPPGSDRFRIWPEDGNGQGRYWCRRCGAEGDAIQFLRDFKNLSFQEACISLGVEARRSPAGAPPSVPGPRALEKVTTSPPAELWQQKATAFVSHCHQQLLARPAELAWLEQRGLPLPAVQLYQLGWNDGEKGRGCIFRPRASWGLPEALKENGQQRLLWIPRGLVIPTMAGGRVARLRIRRPDADLNEATGRYFVVPGSNMAALHLPPAHPEKPHAYAVVESALDAMMVHYQFGQKPDGDTLSTGLGVVGIDTAQIGRMEAPIFEALSQAAVILQSGDFDEAGRKGWERWPATFPRCKRWPAVQGKDPGEDFKAGVNIRSWVLAGLPPVLTLPPQPTAKSEIERQLDERFAAAKAFLEPHLPQLLEKGWTRAQLFGRGSCNHCEQLLVHCPKYRPTSIIRQALATCFPFGGWGLAFSELWVLPNASHEILSDGSIQHTFFDTRCRLNNGIRIAIQKPGE